MRGSGTATVSLEAPFLPLTIASSLGWEEHLHAVRSGLGRAAARHSVLSFGMRPTSVSECPT